MPTLKQQKARKIYLQNIRNNLGMTKRDILLKAGYPEQIADSPAAVFDSKYFKRHLDAIDDTKIIQRWNGWATIDKDKRVALEAGKEILKLKQRYPEPRLKIGLFKEEQTSYIEE